MTILRLQIFFSILVFFTALAFKIPFFRSRKIGDFSLWEFLLLFIIPSLIFPTIFLFIHHTILRPTNRMVVFKDSWLIAITLLAVLYTYGGIAIHGTSKVLSSFLKKGKRPAKAFLINDWFHGRLSHNLVYNSAIWAMVGGSLLELNHLPEPISFPTALIIIEGIIVGGSFLAGLIWYLRYKSSHLRFFPLSFWLCFLFLIYGSRPYFDQIFRYPVAMMALTSFSLLAPFNFFLLFFYPKEVKKK